MSYDLYCYKSKLGVPDEEEADSVIESDTDKWVTKEKDAVAKLAIVKAIISKNQKLQATDFHYGDVTKLSASIIEKEAKKFNRIAIFDPAGDTSLELTVYDNHVFITVPYCSKGNQAKQLFHDINDYVKIINETAGYFVYDPQSGKVFDPKEEELDGLNKYLSITEHLTEIISEQPITTNIIKKPRWKLW
jgi:hypothetical protein